MPRFQGAVGCDIAFCPPPTAIIKTAWRGCKGVALIRECEVRLKRFAENLLLILGAGEALWKEKKRRFFRVASTIIAALFCNHMDKG
mmetsp:Transcript_4747/g.11154  ORF Transcript_4747/g.11154 Transcript_4747/m.11154 type:complete len:87 (+) Transcript_4747:1191-1451(+)